MDDGPWQPPQGVGVGLLDRFFLRVDLLMVILFIVLNQEDVMAAGELESR